MSNQINTRHYTPLNIDTLKRVKYMKKQTGLTSLSSVLAMAVKKGLDSENIPKSDDIPDSILNVK